MRNDATGMFPSMHNHCPELATKIPGFSGKIQSEIFAESEYEITEELEKVLTTTESHFIQETEEDEHIIELVGGKNVQIAQVRRRYWPRQWDVYLHSFDYLELSYRRNWYWWQVRETIKRTPSGILGWPLARLTFYEPQSEVDVCFEPIPNEIDNPGVVEVNQLADAMPSSRASKEEDLEELARLAFPVTKEERSKAAEWKKLRISSGTWKAARKRLAKRKTAKRRAAIKKVAKKKSG